MLWRPGRTGRHAGSRSYGALRRHRKPRHHTPQRRRSRFDKLGRLQRTSALTQRQNNRSRQLPRNFHLQPHLHQPPLIIIILTRPLSPRSLLAGAPSALGADVPGNRQQTTHTAYMLLLRAGTTGNGCLLPQMTSGSLCYTALWVRAPTYFRACAGYSSPLTPASAWRPPPMRQGTP